MNKDYTSDIRQVQRFMFQNSIYLLNMFQKKVSSFITPSTKSVRQNQKAFLLNQKNNIEPSSFFQNPIKQLARDLTKPIWNCVVKVEPKVILSSENSEKFNIEQSMSLNLNRQLYCKMLRTFISRFKIQHEDQSNLQIQLVEYDTNLFYQALQKQKVINQDQKSKTKNRSLNQLYQKNQKYTLQLLKLIDERIFRQYNLLIQIIEGEDEQKYTFLKICLQAYTQILNMYFEESQNMKTEMNSFICSAVQAVNDILDSKCGSTLLTVQPKINAINLVIHPMLITIHNCLKLQINFTLQKQQKKRNELKSEVKIEVQQDLKSKKNIYQDLKLMNVSKIVFINLDGYQSDANLQIVKYLSKYLMYVSFPKESTNKKQHFQSNLKQFQSFKSQRLLKMYFQSFLSQSQKASQLKLHEADEKQMKKNMYIFPIHSQILSEKYELDQNTNIQFYQSTFVKFMMEEIVMPQIRQFNPSLIILSYSGKIKIDSAYFTQLIKQLTVASNFRFLFFPNQAKMFAFQEKDPKIVTGQQFLKLEQLYYQNFQKSINPLQNKAQYGLKIDFMEKLSIFLKVSSGTFNLSKTIEEDSYIQKFKNYKVMRYSALLLKQLAKEYSTIQKLKMRANEYLTISKVLKNTYTNKTDTFDKLFGKVIPKYYVYLLKCVEKYLFLQKQNEKINQAKQINVENQQNQQFQYTQISKKINEKYDYVSKKELWEDFKFQFCLEISTQKTQNRIYCHIPRYRQKGQLSKPAPKKRSVDNLLSLQFQILDQKTKQKLAVQLTSNSQICYSKQRKNKEALIYIFNHASSSKSEQFQNFYGVINQIIDIKSQLRVPLKKVHFIRNKKLSCFQHLIQFNFFQTENFILLFWPKIFDQIKDKLLRIIGQKYIPQSTLEIYKANKSTPFNFLQLKPSNLDYNDIIPRYGCKCYQYQNSNRIYIFGGFYNDNKNYLKFQTDISFIEYSQETNQLKVKNLPKSFYFQISNFNNTNSVQQIKNDLVRPRIQYEILEVQIKENQDIQKFGKEIFLIGGVGQKFMRPYSIICYMAHKLIFSQKGQLKSIKRIKTNNLIAANVSNPTKIRSSREMNIVNNAQNRNIYLNQGIATSDSYVISFNKYFYDPNQEKFDFNQQYEFAQYDKKNYREDIAYLKKTPVEYPIKYQLVAKNCRGKQFYDNFITVSSENGKKYIFQLQFQLPLQVRQIQINLPKIVRLTGASILALDINSSMLYCLIKHPNFTCDKCVLAHFDINDLAGKLIDSKSVQVTLKQVHKFQDDVSKNIIVVANSTTVAILHGSKFNKNVQLPQMILKRQRKNQIKTYAVKPCTDLYEIQLPLKSKLINEISSSLFLNQNNGVILCLSFKSIDRQIKQGIVLIQIVYVRIQELNLAKDDHRWKKKHQQIYKFYLNPNKKQIQGEEMQKIKKDYFKLLQIKSNKQKKDKIFIIKGIYLDQIYSGLLNIENVSEIVQFKSLQISVDEYYKSIYRQNIKQESIMLDKNPYFYQQLEEQCVQISKEKMQQQIIMEAEQQLQKFQEKDQQRIRRGKKQMFENEMKQ